MDDDCDICYSMVPPAQPRAFQRGGPLCDLCSHAKIENTSKPARPRLIRCWPRKNSHPQRDWRHQEASGDWSQAKRNQRETSGLDPRDPGKWRQVASRRRAGTGSAENPDGARWHMDSGASECNSCSFGLNIALGSTAPSCRYRCRNRSQIFLLFVATMGVYARCRRDGISFIKSCQRLAGKELVGSRLCP
jgi:hypothetical protein